MLTQETRRRIDKARDILVGQLPLPSDQIELITIALIYKFMGDIDEQSHELGGKPTFFIGALRDLSWQKLISNTLTAEERVTKFIQGIEAISDPKQTHIPDLFKSIFKNAFLKFRDAQVLKLFLDEINGFTYDHSEELGNAFEYLLDTMGTQGQNGQFRTPRNIIEFIVDVVDPQKEDTILDPACGTAGFLISAYKHIMAANTSPKAAEKDPHAGDRLTSGQRDKLTRQVVGYDITPLMCRLSRVNMYLHHFANPIIHEYDTLTNKNRWGDKFDVILANPPFMTPSGGVRTHDKFRIAASRAEVLFADFILEHLNPNGRAGFIVPEGIIFQNNEDYVNLRKWLVNEAGLWAAVSLPAQIFQPYSGVKTSVILVDRALARQRNDIVLVKVENDGFSLNTNRNPIQANDLPAALQLLTVAKQADYASQLSTLNSQLPLAHRLVPRADFAKLDAYKATSAAWEFCRKFRTRADRLEKAIAEAKAAQDQDEIERAAKVLKKLTEEFPAATGLAKLPETEPGLRAAFESFIKAPATTYGQNPGQPGNLTADLLKTIDGDRDYNLSFDRKHTAGTLDRETPYEWVTIGELCRSVNGRAFKPADWEPAAKGGLPIIRIQNLNNPDADLNYYSGAVAPKNLVVHGDLLFSWSGSKGTSFGPHIWHGARAILNQHIFHIIHDDRVDRHYLYWALKRVTEEVEKNLHGGVGLVHITKPKFEALKLPVPPLDEQLAIAQEIDSYQKVIDGARAVLNNYRPRIPIDPGWPVMNLAAIITSKPKNGYSGKPVDHPTKLRVLSLSATTSGTMDLTKFKFLDEDIHLDAACRCRRGDIYLQRGNTKELVGTAAMFDSDDDNYIYPDLMIRVRADEEKIDRYYLLNVLQSPPVREYLMKNAGGAAGSMPKINQAIVERVPIPLPPLATQQAIVAEIKTEQALVAANRELITRFGQKIQATLARIWGEAPPAEPPPRPQKTKDSKPQPVAA